MKTVPAARHPTDHPRNQTTMAEKEPTEATFQEELRELVLRSFGEGKCVEGVWDLEYDPEELPDWTVTVDRKDSL